jgi:hypothetical protein
MKPLLKFTPELYPERSGLLAVLNAFQQVGDAGLLPLLAVRIMNFNLLELKGLSW